MLARGSVGARTTVSWPVAHGGGHEPHLSQRVVNPVAALLRSREVSGARGRHCNGRGGTKRVRLCVRFVELLGGRRASSDGSACRGCQSRRREWREGGEAGPRACQCIGCASPLLEQFVGHRGGPRLLSLANPDTRPGASTSLRRASPLSPCHDRCGRTENGAEEEKKREQEKAERHQEREALKEERRKEREQERKRLIVVKDAKKVRPLHVHICSHDDMCNCVHCFFFDGLNGQHVQETWVSWDMVSS